jgi:streptomycin 6-kinase
VERHQPDNAAMDLSSRISFSLSHWHLRDVNRLAGGFRSDVFASTTDTDEEVVLKLTVTTEETEIEAAALRAWSDTGAAVRLLDVDVEHAALLLERLRPATPLPGNDDVVAIDVVAGLLSRLHLDPIGYSLFPTLDKIYPRLEAGSREDAAYEQRASGDPTRGLPGLRRLDRARALAMRLCATTDQAVLLHGDVLDKNLLWDGTGYVAIDPIPRIGDPCSEVGFFASGHPPATAILERATAIAARMDLDPYRAREWAAVWAVLETCSAWRPDQSDLEACLASDAFERLLTQ